MATLFTYCSNIKKIARAAKAISDDDPLQLKQIALWMDYYRMKAIQLSSDWGKEWSMLTQIQQRKNCVEIIRRDITECKGYEWGEKVLKVKNFPKFLDLPEQRSQIYVGRIDGRRKFNYAEPNAISDKLKTRFGDLFSYYYIIPSAKGVDIYVVPCDADGGKDLEVFSVNGVAESPSQWDECILADADLECTPDYPLISGTAADIMIQVLTKELNVTLKTATDLVNNAQLESAV